MPYVRSFTNVAPPARYDAVPFTTALVQEAPAITGPWTTIETIVLNPVDANPAAPQARNLTTDGATLAAGWYRIVWRDAALNTVEGDPIKTSLPAGLSLSDLKTYLNLEQGRTDKDSLLTTVLNGVVRQVEGFTKRNFTPDTGTHATRAAAEWRGGFIRLPDARAVTAVRVAGVAVAAADRRLVYNKSDEPAIALEIYRPYYPTWNDDGYAIEVDGDFGFSPLPDDVKDAMLQMAARRYRQRDAGWGDAAQLDEGPVVNYFRQLSPEVQGILEDYRLADAFVA